MFNDLGEDLAVQSGQAGMLVFYMDVKFNFYSINAIMRFSNVCLLDRQAKREKRPWERGCLVLSLN